MWDMKLYVPCEIRGEFVPIQTNVSGIEICELLPRLGTFAVFTASVSLPGDVPDEYSVWRVHPRIDHGRRKHIPHGNVTRFGDRRSPDEITTIVSLMFLGVRLECAKCHHHPFEVYGQEDFYSFAAYFAMVGRKGTGLENPFFARTQANRIWADQLGRGLIEPADDLHGGRCVALSYSRWDWHVGNFGRARHDFPMLDQTVSALIEDLEQRGMFDNVSIVVRGEFGHTPQINGSAGRNHWPRVGPCLLAGGGLRRWQVIGETKRLSEHSIERPDDQ